MKRGLVDTRRVDAYQRWQWSGRSPRVCNLPSLPGVFPDYAAPIVRNSPDGRNSVVVRPADHLPR